MQAYAKSLLVDRNALNAAQNNHDVVLCQEILQTAYQTDVRALVAEARLKTGGALDPLRLFRHLKIREGLIKERGAMTVATGL
jgi:L-rhamnose isomerase/sugar isomerase